MNLLFFIIIIVCLFYNSNQSELGNKFCDLDKDCNQQLGLSCINSICKCLNSQYWNGSICVMKFINNQNCSFDHECDDTVGLYCTSDGTCGCLKSEGSWDGIMCRTYNYSLMNYTAELFSILESPLWRVAMAGSHDSGTYKIDPLIDNGCGLNGGAYFQQLVQTQSRNYYEQLSNGIRFFDLRPVYIQDTFYAYHDGYTGAQISDMFNDIVLFMQQVTKELVILDISHFCGFTDNMHQDFLNLINETLSDYFYDNLATTNQSLNIKIREIVQDGPKVIVIYEDDYIISNPIRGICNSLSIYNNYSNTINSSYMQNDQAQKLVDHQGSPRHLFLLSYTLTPPVLSSVFGYLQLISDNVSILRFASEVNPTLPAFLKQFYHDYWINILYADYEEIGHIGEVSVQLNKLKLANVDVLACKSDHDCDENNGLKCVNATRCRCFKNSYLDGSQLKCAPLKLNGYKCDSNRSCNLDKGLNCINGVCSCNSNAYWNPKYETCGMPRNLIKATSCPNGYKYSSENNKCIQICPNNFEIYSDSESNENYCRHICPNGYTDLGTSCLKSIDDDCPTNFTELDSNMCLKPILKVTEMKPSCFNDKKLLTKDGYDEIHLKATKNVQVVCAKKCEPHFIGVQMETKIEAWCIRK